MKILSIIVPSYNSEQFLDKGIPSMLEPSVIDKLDIIIVNDGSKDATPEVAQKYCDMHPQSVRLINQENKGHGGALNTGCAAAVGKYLKVIDADDWVETENLPAYISFLEGCDSDVVLTHHYTIDISNGEVKKWKSFPPEFGRPYTFKEIMADWRSFDRSLTFHGITYNTEFYHKNGIQLSEHVFYEDHEFATFPACCAESVTPFDMFIYDYRIGDVLQSVSEQNQLKRVSHTETVLNRILTESARLSHLPEGNRSYIAQKGSDLLLSYFTTVLLVEPDRKKGREEAYAMLQRFKENLPEAYGKAFKKYRIFLAMNRLNISRKLWDKILRSKLYNKIRGNHDFN